MIRFQVASFASLLPLHEKEGWSQHVQPRVLRLMTERCGQATSLVIRATRISELRKGMQGIVGRNATYCIAYRAFGHSELMAPYRLFYPCVYHRHAKDVNIYLARIESTA